VEAAELQSTSKSIFFNDKICQYLGDERSFTKIRSFLNIPRISSSLDSYLWEAIFKYRFRGSAIKHILIFLFFNSIFYWKKPYIELNDHNKVIAPLPNICWPDLASFPLISPWSKCGSLSHIGHGFFGMMALLSGMMTEMGNQLASATLRYSNQILRYCCPDLVLILSSDGI